MRPIIPLFALYLFISISPSAEGSLHSKDLCEVEGCSCSPDQLELYCKCPHKEVIRIGDSDNSAGVSSPPDSIRKLVIEECHHVEIMSRAFNRLPYIRNVTLNKAHSIVIHPRVFNSRQSQIGASLPLENFVISNVRNLEVRRHSFEGIEIYGTFSLNNVLLKSVPSLSFSFDFVNEFEIIGSRLHRISMWGIKLPKCHEFRSIEKTAFLSLSSHALYMSCQNFILLQNTFGSLHDASMNVSYRYAEIRKNTFETITGKPFTNLRPQPEGGSFIFRENKFRVDSPLPEEALSIPEFGNSVDTYIDNNHFICDCEKLSWLIHSVRETLDEEPPAFFLRELVKTSGKCLTCNARHCHLGEKDFLSFLKDIVVTKSSDGGYDCSKRPEDILEGITEKPLKITEGLREEEEFVKNEEELFTEMKSVPKVESKPILKGQNVIQPVDRKDGSDDDKEAISAENDPGNSEGSASSLSSVFVPLVTVIIFNYYILCNRNYIE